MRIISTEHDYYDCMMDPSDTDVWVRPKTQEVYQPVWTPQYKTRHNKQDIWPFRTFFSRKNHEYHVSLIGFCGKLYPCIEHIDRTTTPSATSYIYDVDSIWEDMSHKERTSRTKWSNMTKEFEGFKRVCEKLANYELAKTIFADYKIPYFIRTRHKIILMPLLKGYQFYKVVNLHQAIQEIEMYLYGVLGYNREVVPEIPDKILAEAKGFDKYSFRKGPTKHG